MTDRFGDLGEGLFAVQLCCHAGQLVEDHLQGGFQIVAQLYRVATGDVLAHALIIDRLEQHGRGRRPITDLFVQMP